MLREYDRSQLAFRSAWRLEITGLSIMGLPPAPIQRKVAEHTLTLDEEIGRCWFEAGWCYTYGLFQSSVLLAAIVAELVLERYLRSKQLWSDYTNEVDESQRTLGSMINFCKPRKDRGPYVTSKILRKFKELNELRIEAAHLKVRRNLTLALPEKPSLNEIDEVQQISQKEINKNGKEVLVAYSWVEDIVLIDPETTLLYKVRAFKLYAKRALILASEISSLMFELG